jgi:5-methylcytosine-specific restriction endonuclease McrA
VLSQVSSAAADETWGTRPIRRDRLDYMQRRMGEIERVAIWTAHSKRCAYCGEPLRYPDLEIDHILPLSLTKSPGKLKELISQLALPSDFSIVSLRNLLPAHRICNSRKRDRVFNEANARYFLEIADQKLRSIEDLIPKLELEASRDMLLALVRSALQSGNADLGDILDAASNTHKFPLNVTVNFESGSWEVVADSEQINRLFDEPVDLHVEGKERGVRFTDGKGSDISISTCREYKAAIAAGYYPSDNSSLKVSFALATTSAILEAASHARLAPISYIRSPRHGMTDFSLLPATLAPTKCLDGSDIVSQSGSTTIQELVEAGSISATILSDTKVEIECQDQGVALTELMRADFDDDGVDEVLIEVHSYIKFATFRSLNIGLLRKKDTVSLFEYQSWDREIEMAQHRHQIARIVRIPPFD